MNKLLKIGATIGVGLFCLSSLSSCGLSGVEKDAKAYIKEHAEDFENFDAGGLGLKYESDSCSFNFSSGKGTYTGMEVEFKFSADYDWEEDDLEFEVTKVVTGDPKTYGFKFAEESCKLEIAAAYATVAIANELHDYEQEDE